MQWFQHHTAPAQYLKSMGHRRFAAQLKGVEGHRLPAVFVHHTPQEQLDLNSYKRMVDTVARMLELMCE